MRTQPFYDLKYTVVFCTNVIPNLDSLEMKDKIAHIIREICNSKEMKFLGLETSSTRLYLSLLIGPDRSLADRIDYLKHRSSSELYDALDGLVVEDSLGLWNEHYVTTARIDDLLGDTITFSDIDGLADDAFAAHQATLFDEEDIEDEPEEEPVTRLRVVNS
jgi:REP element-mobilizing transposase RayT